MATISNAAITNNQDPWLADLGTSNHLIANLDNLSIQSWYKGLDQVTVGNGLTLPINHISNASLHTFLAEKCSSCSQDCFKLTICAQILFS